MKYTVITHSDPGGLSEKVTELLNEGWELRGGVAVSCTEYAIHDEREGYDRSQGTEVYAQAMTHSAVD